ncbi:glycosyltransferase involved in cell wall biosynthesis [Agrobacterium vitis]|nr:glycosyltransferase involved in cell wall biosynthesis [Agrobacterium vitis]MBE1436635.1 glycosyltransferase involved in cell wall biosynthesis [Agrobacterium vitis]
MTDLHINVYAQNYGWLFEDLKRHFTSVARPGLKITASVSPDPDADRWIALRTAESHLSPAPWATVTCIHDFFDDPGLYTPTGARRGIHEAGAVWLCHPDIQTLLARDGVVIGDRPVLIRPIGALQLFKPRLALEPRFRIGWIGRNDPVKQLPLFIKVIAAAQKTQDIFDVVLVGEDLSPIEAEVSALDVKVHHIDRRVVSIEECPPAYSSLDALVITSKSEGQPMVLFEALACGVPVVSTPTGWAEWFAGRVPDYVQLAESPDQFASALLRIRQSRQSLFAKRFEMAAAVEKWRLENWVDALVALACGLERGERS